MFFYFTEKVTIRNIVTFEVILGPSVISIRKYEYDVYLNKVFSIMLSMCLDRLQVRVPSHSLYLTWSSYPTNNHMTSATTNKNKNWLRIEYLIIARTRSVRSNAMRGGTIHSIGQIVIRPSTSQLYENQN